MIELPEAVVVARQVTETLQGKRIASAVAGQSPHKFAWYTGDPAEYNERLAGKTVGAAAAFGNHIEIEAGDMLLVVSTALRYHAGAGRPPKKHQLLVELDDGTALSATVQMWGVLLCYPAGEQGGLPDYRIARQRPSPLSDAFDRAYFDGLCDERTAAMPAKAFLATEQRIPGLGNGVLQDILWTARVHPRRKMATLSGTEVGAMYEAVKPLLAEMAVRGGRDTERDLFGRPGGYRTVLSKNTVGRPCPACGSTIAKDAFLGGAIYYCPGCQPL